MPVDGSGDDFFSDENFTKPGSKPASRQNSHNSNKAASPSRNNSKGLSRENSLKKKEPVQRSRSPKAARKPEAKVVVVQTQSGGFGGFDDNEADTKAESTPGWDDDDDLGLGDLGLDEPAEPKVEAKPTKVAPKKDGGFAGFDDDDDFFNDF